VTGNDCPLLLCNWNRRSNIKGCTSGMNATGDTVPSFAFWNGRRRFLTVMPVTPYRLAEMISKTPSPLIRSNTEMGGRRQGWLPRRTTSVSMQSTAPKRRHHRRSRRLLRCGSHISSTVGASRPTWVPTVDHPRREADGQTGHPSG
jgi:hypothetical protein